MANELQAFLESHRSSRQRESLALRWTRLPSMAQSVSLLDKKVAELEGLPGGMAKLREWFLSDDAKLTSITAERYVIDYLRRCNPQFIDLLQGNDVDGVLHTSAGKIGVEVTTLNRQIGDWIFIERLTQLLDDRGQLTGRAIEICRDPGKIPSTAPRLIDQYIDRVAECFESRPIDCSGLGIEIVVRPGSGTVAWHDTTEGASDPAAYFELLTDGILHRIEAKANQLDRPHNVLIVGVNHHPTLWYLPGLFQQMGGQEHHLGEMVAEIATFWAENIPAHVEGVVYYVYDLSKEQPYYPLRMFGNSQLSLVESIDAV